MPLNELFNSIGDWDFSCAQKILALFDIETTIVIPISLIYCTSSSFGQFEIVIVEALRNLHRLPETFTLVAFPIKLKDMDGAPVRAIAIVDE